MIDNMYRNRIVDRRKHLSRGFTLAEVLIVVAILAVLLAVSIPSVVYYRKNLRQKELDEKAQIIYVAAQNQLAMLEAEGKTDLYDPEKNSELKPSVSVSGDSDVRQIYYISHELSVGNDWEPLSDTLAYALMYSSDIDGNTDSALSKNSWIIEVDPQSASVYSVFYSEDSKVDLTDPAAFSEYRESRKIRIQKGANVGFYGGDTAGAESSKVFLYPTVTVYNEEVLYASIQCYSKDSDIRNNLCYEITISNSGDSSAKVTGVVPADALKNDNNRNTYILVLDDLGSSSTRFHNMYPELDAGKDIVITVSAYIDPDADIDRTVVTRTASAETNSLFADKDNYSAILKVKGSGNTAADDSDTGDSDEEGGSTPTVADPENTAVIMYARHLQNLDELSGVSEDITEAIQISDIDLSAEQPSGEERETNSAEYFRSCYASCDHGDSKIFDAQGVTVYDENSIGTQYLKNSVKYYNGQMTFDGTAVPAFRPINNGNLEKYTGAFTDKNGKIISSHSISGLTVSNVVKPDSASSDISYSADCGLFGSGSTGLKTIRGIDLVDAAVCSTSGGGTAGALAGKLGCSDLEIINVRSYLSVQGRTGEDGEKRTNEDIWISAETAGGLIGSISGGEVSLENCEAASVVGDTEDDTADGILKGDRAELIEEAAGKNIKTAAAGGLAGAVTGGTVIVKHSYADNYLCGRAVGGLIGKTSGTVSLEECYAAGFAYGFRSAAASADRYMAGLAGGRVSQKNSYTVLTYLTDETEDADSTAAGTASQTASASDGLKIYSTSISADSSEKVYYTIASSDAKTDLRGTTLIGEMTTEELAAALGDGFRTDTGDTIAYNLAGQNLTTYPYPRLEDPYVNGDSGDESSERITGYLAHQNDWLDEFKPGSLVYFEEYGALTEAVDAFLAQRNSASDHSYTEADLLNIGDGRSVMSTEGDTAGQLQPAAETPEPTYGFYGANVDALKQDREVLGDGYAVVYRTTDEMPDRIEVRVTVDDAVTGTEHTLSQTISLKDTAADTYVKPYSVTAEITVDNRKQTAEFLIYPIGAEMSSTDLASYDYYQKVSLNAISDVDQTGETGSDTGAAASSTSYFAYNPHLAKSVIAIQDGSADLPDIAAGSSIYVRTPRQLYELSRHYDVYADASAGAVFTQELDIDYVIYDWTGGVTGHDYFRDPSGQKAADRIREQLPIGQGQTGSYKAFSAEYEGKYHEIRNISFAAGEDGEYAGLFGVNRGTISNVFLPADYAENSSSNRYAVISKTIGMNTGAHIGSLAGLNASGGTIKNCAAAGFTFGKKGDIIDAYESSNVFAGGLVGRNDGTITQCSSDTPLIKLNMNFSYDYLGGFTGYNTGYINNCYAIGAISTPSVRGGNVSIGGFAGYNTGTIGASYCAVSLVASGENTSSYGFTSKDGSVYDCTYLDQGTFNYVKHQYAYSADTGVTAGDSATYEGLQKQAADSAAQLTAANSRNHNNTLSASGIYPFRGVVKDSDGTYIHYGEWQDDCVMGTLGVIYWEHETEGKNNGYHFTFLGTAEGSDLTMTPVKGTSLCNAHDDGGVISEYGYGFYVISGLGSRVSLETENLDISDDGSHSVVNTDAKQALSDQMTGYDVYPFTTRVTEDGGTDHIWLREDECIANGTLKLTFTGTDTQPGTAVTVKYSISPFFANAMQYESYRIGDGPEVENTEEIKVTAADYSETDFSRVPGSNENRYEIRSAEQLQYINWNYASADCSQLVGSSSGSDSYYRNFTYLFQASITQQGTQTREAAHNNTERSWYQSHDLNAEDTGNWTPIAAAGVTSQSNYNAILYAWFGGSFDGGNYKIKNIKIKSKAYSVGLFGVTAGADICNVIMYSDDNSVIQRYTDDTGSHNDHAGAYSLGGLIGVAYDYLGSSTSEHTIKNCAIAGYRIQDNSKSYVTLGETCIGGLIGDSNVDLKKCSAVTDISINSLYGPHNGSGGYVRCGGMTGANFGKITDCYTGGSISVSDDTLNEAYNSSGGKISEGASYTGAVLKDRNNHIFIAGISACAFSSTYQNFDNYSGSRNGTPTFNNCYTYEDLPDIEGTIRAVSIIGSVGDRFGSGNQVPKFNNCYYLESTADIGVNMPAYHIRAQLTTEDMEANWLTQMLMGDLEYCKTYYWNDSASKDYSKSYNGLTSLTYEQMASRLGKLSGDSLIQPVKNPLTGDLTGESFKSFADALNNGNSQSRSVWSYVTIKEGSGISIDGKYSFPGKVSSLNGKNYPFATVIKQKNIAYSSAEEAVYVNVHYGRWPVNGLCWDSAKADMDLFEDMDLVSTPGDADSTYGYAVKDFVLKDPTGKLKGVEITKDSFTVNGVSGGDSKYAEVTDAYYDETAKECTITVKALKSGSAVIAYNDVSFDLDISAEKLNISLVPDESTVDYDADTVTMTYRDGTEAKLELHAGCAGESDNISTGAGLSWRVSVSKGTAGDLATLDITDPTGDELDGCGYVLLAPGVSDGSWQLQIRAELIYPFGSSEGTSYTAGKAAYITFECGDASSLGSSAYDEDEEIEEEDADLAEEYSETEEGSEASSLGISEAYTETDPEYLPEEEDNTGYTEDEDNEDEEDDTGE